MSISNAPAQLTKDEAGRLAELEAIVKAGLTTFREVGNALLEIRDGRLYRETHRTFEEYLERPWSMSRAHGYRLIDGARVVEAMSPIGDTLANEAQARELAPLLDQPDRLREAWQEAVDRTDGEPTAAAVRDVIRDIVISKPPTGVHPAAIFPPMQPDEFDGLVKSIKTHGLLVPIVLHEGLVLDGRERLRACEQAGVEARFVEADLNGRDPYEYVVSANLLRQHLTPAQRAAALEVDKIIETEGGK